MLELSLNVLDLAQNSLTAGAKLVEIELREGEGMFSIAIRDDGCGMTPEFLQRVTDPFTTTRTTRKVGFGLPFIQQLCDMTGGALRIESQVGVGTSLVATMGLDHIDRPPLGDIQGTMISLLIPNQHVDFVFTYATPEGEYVLDTRDVKEALDGLPFTDPDVIVWLMQNIDEGLEELTRRA